MLVFFEHLRNLDGTCIMRLIGHLKTETSARTFGDYLTSLNIRNLIEPESDGWAVWVYAEDQIEAGHSALAGYLANPGDSKFVRASETAAAVRVREEQKQAQYAKRVRTSANLWPSLGFGWMTLALIIASIIVTLLCFYSVKAGQWFMMSQTLGLGFLPEVRQGQVWRLISPIFIHMGFQHLVFDMYALYILGSLVEAREGALRLLLLTLILGAASNVGQYAYAGPLFGGMSGVVYGLFGYAWIRGKVDAGSGYYLDSVTIIIMLGWYFLCLFNVIGLVANAAHSVGLLLGMMWGAAPLLKPD
jgi:GlpG protein